MAGSALMILHGLRARSLVITNTGSCPSAARYSHPGPTSPGPVPGPGGVWGHRSSSVPRGTECDGHGLDRVATAGSDVGARAASNRSRRLGPALASRPHRSPLGLCRDDPADHAFVPGADELGRALRRGEPHGLDVAVAHRTGADAKAVDGEVVVLVAVVADLDRHRGAGRDLQDLRLEPVVPHDQPQRPRRCGARPNLARCRLPLPAAREHDDEPDGDPGSYQHPQATHLNPSRSVLVASQTLGLPADRVVTRRYRVRWSPASRAGLTGARRWYGQGASVEPTGPTRLGQDLTAASPSGDDHGDVAAYRSAVRTAATPTRRLSAW